MTSGFIQFFQIMHEYSSFAMYMKSLRRVIAIKNVDLFSTQTSNQQTKYD